MPIQFEFSTDSDTKAILDIVVYFLEKYFSYTKENAIIIINDFYRRWKDNVMGDDFYHRKEPYHVAVMIHYVIGLQLNLDSFSTWCVQNGYTKTPREAIEYYNINYVKK